MQTESKTLVQFLEALSKTSHRGITFIAGADQEVYLSYEDLYQEALGYLGYLQHRGVRPADELVFQIESNRTFVICFWACMLGGFRAVPLSISYHSDTAQKLYRIWPFLNNPYLIASRHTVGKLEQAAKNGVGHETNSIGSEKTILTEELEKYRTHGSIHPVTAQDIAFIQFSSGSTGTPKGVTITHHNVVTNILDTCRAAAITQADKSLSWMPLTHDMGLIGFHLNQIVMGVDQYIMPTELFVRRPFLWLHKLSEHRITLTASPNFGYLHLMSQFTRANAQVLDLSSVRLIFNGAEPISADVCRTFLKAMQAYGLGEATMFTVYGLAEATLGATFPPPGTSFSSVRVSRQTLGMGQQVAITDQANDLELVNVGRPLEHCRVRVTNERGMEVAAGEIGYVCIQGDSVTSGYYNNASVSREIIQDGWLNTFDLGFVFQGDLFITGRAKDVIFVGGQNIYAHDIERIAEELEAVEPGKLVACGVPDDQTKSDALVLFMLFKHAADKLYPITLQLKRLVSQKLGVEVRHVVAVRNIPKTTSGKVMRFKLVEQFNQGEFNHQLAELTTIHQRSAAASFSEKALTDYSANAIGQWIRNWLHIRLNTPLNQINLRQSFADHGVTSLMAVELAKNLAMALGFEVDTTVAWSFSNIHTLSEYLADQVKNQDPDPSTVSSPQPSPVNGKHSAQQQGMRMEMDLDNLSEEELAQLLTSELAKK